jgi:hypothetical protein
MDRLWRFLRLGMPAIIVGSLVAMSGCRREPVGRILVYEVDEFDADEAGLSEALVAAANRRLGSSGRARAVEEGRIEIDLYGQPSDGELGRIDRLLARPGTLAFRILANRRDTPPAEIDRALESFPDSSSEMLEWLPLREPTEFDEHANPEPRCPVPMIIVFTLPMAPSRDLHLDPRARSTRGIQPG